jgi:hypothetical protein
VPLVGVWALARRFAVPAWGAALMVLIPTYTSRLSFAFLPSLLGHAVDVCFIVWLAGRLGRLAEPRVLAGAALLLSACQLAYVSGTTQTTLLVVVLAACLVARRSPGALRGGLGLLGAALAASVLSIAVYYRDFVPMALDLASQALPGSAGAASRYPVQAWHAVALERTHSFFDTIHPLLAAVGLAVLLRLPAGPLAAAWLATYLLLLLGRARLPDVFLHGHETLLVTPLVCLASGVALARLWHAAAWARALAALLFAALALQGLHGQWRAIAEQLGNAL